MKFSNTKQAFKTIGSDVKVLIKDLGKLGKDTVVNLPKATVNDFRAESALRKEFREWRKTRNNPDSNPET